MLVDTMEGRPLYTPSLLGSVLVLGIDADATTVEVVRLSQDARQKPAATLTDTEWHLRTVYGTVLKRAEIDPTVFVYLSDKSGANAYTGYTGCNRFNGSYSSSENSIEFSEAAITMMACQNAQDSEQNFLRALQAMDQYRIVGETLNAYANNVLIATFDTNVRFADMSVD
jgi:heat shock protein HslJ